MPTVGLRNVEAQQIGSVDHLDVEDRNFGAEWYDAAGGGSLGSAILPLGTTRHNSAPEIYDITSNILKIAEAGLYVISFSVTIASGASTEKIFSAVLEEDPDTTTFSTVPGSYTAMTVFSGQGTLFNSILLRSGIDYRYRVAVASLSGSGSSFYAGGSKLSIFRLFKNG